MEQSKLNNEYVENPIVNLAFMGIKDLQMAIKKGYNGEKEFMSLLSCLPDPVYKEGERPIIKQVYESKKHTEECELKIQRETYPKSMSDIHVSEIKNKKIKKLYHEMYFEIIRTIVNRLDEVYHITERKSHTSVNKI